MLCDLPGSYIPGSNMVATRSNSDKDYIEYALECSKVSNSNSVVTIDIDCCRYSTSVVDRYIEYAL